MILTPIHRTGPLVAMLAAVVSPRNEKPIPPVPIFKKSKNWPRSKKKTEERWLCFRFGFVFSGFDEVEQCLVAGYYGLSGRTRLGRRVWWYWRCSGCANCFHGFYLLEVRILKCNQSRERGKLTCKLLVLGVRGAGSIFLDSAYPQSDCDLVATVLLPEMPVVCLYSKSIFDLPRPPPVRESIPSNQSWQYLHNIAFAGISRHAGYQVTTGCKFCQLHHGLWHHYFLDPSAPLCRLGQMLVPKYCSGHVCLFFILKKKSKFSYRFFLLVFSTRHSIFIGC